jgi:predicted DNA-binding transcriptional regulator YafY
MTRIERLMALTEHLRGRRTGTTVAALAERFGVSVRTIHRDLDALRHASVPVQGERGRGGGLSLDRSYTLPPVNFTAHEAAVLVSLGEWIERARIMPFVDTLRTALSKVRGALPTQRQRALDRLRQSMLFTGVPTRTASPEVRSIIEQAWLDDAELVVVYAKKGQAGVPRRIRIRALVLTRAETLLNCDDLDKGEPRQLQLHRIEAAWPALPE